MGIRVIPGLVSVIFPVYGNFDIEKLLISVDSVKRQKEVDFEIVVSEVNKEPRLKGLLDPGINYVFNKTDPEEQLKGFNQGRVRNLGVKSSSGEYVYHNEADIIFESPFFLKECKVLMDLNPFSSYACPHKKRIILDNVELFKKKAREEGLNKALNALSHNNNFFTVMDGIPRYFKIINENYWLSSYAIIARNKSELNKKANEALQNPKVQEGFELSLHFGGILFRRRDFDLLGGFSERFFRWGSVDLDFHWKLDQCFCFESFPKKKDFVVIHMDHLRGYFSEETFAENERIRSLREKSGIVKAVIDDLNCYYKNHWIKRNLKKLIFPVYLRSRIRLIRPN